MVRLLGIALWCFGAHALGQEPEPVDTNVGFLRIINLVAAGEGNLGVRMEGKNHWGEGFKLGDRTGGFKVRSGKIQ